MNFNFHSVLLDRVRRTWDLFCPPPGSHPARDADQLIKLNLPPLMGRRDAAFDCARKMAAGDIFAGDIAARTTVYAAISELLRNAAADTVSILQMLSSPDTEAREGNLLKFLLFLRDYAQSLDDVIKLQAMQLGDGAASLKGLAISRSDSEIVRSEKQLSAYEVNTVNLIRTYFERSTIKIDRYRSYTDKSFSPPNASRYKKAYESYTRLYCGEPDKGVAE